MDAKKIENAVDGSNKIYSNEQNDYLYEEKQFSDSNQVLLSEPKALNQQNLQNQTTGPNIYNRNSSKGANTYRIIKRIDNQIRGVMNSSLEQRNQTLVMAQQLQNSLIQDQITQRDQINKTNSSNMVQSYLLANFDKQQGPIRRRDFSADNRLDYEQSFNEAKNFFLVQQQQQQQNQQPQSIKLPNNQNNSSYIQNPNLLSISATKIQYNQSDQQTKNGSTKSFHNSPFQNVNKSQDKSYLFSSPEWHLYQQQYQQQINQHVQNPQQMLNNQIQNVIKEMKFQSPNSIHNQNNLIYDFSAGGYNHNLNGNNAQEDRNKILKKILAHFNVKVQQMQRKQFMNTFGLEIKQIPTQDINKIKQNANQSHYNNINKKRQQRTINQSEGQNNISDIRHNAISIISKNNEQNKLNQSSSNVQGKHIPKKLNQRHNQRSNSTDQQINDVNENNGQVNSPILNQNELKMKPDEINQNENIIQNSNILCAKSEDNNDDQKNSQPSSESESTKDSNGQNNSNPNINILNSNLIQHKQDRVRTPTNNGNGTTVQQNRKRFNSSYHSGARQQNAMMMFRKLPKNNNTNQNFKFALNDNNFQREEVFFKKFNTFRDFIFKINFTNHMFINIPQENPIYKIAVGRGNNSKLIKNCIKNRWWWQIVEFDDHQQANFLWTQCKVQQFFDRQENLDTPHSEEEINSNDTISIEFQQSRAKIVFQEFNQKGADQARYIQNGNNNQITKQLTNQGNLTSFKVGVSDTKVNNTSINKQPNPFPQYQDHNVKIFSNQDQQVYSKYMSSQLGQKDYYNQNWEDLSFRLKNLKRTNIDKPYKMVENCQKSVTHNHLQFNFHLGNKKALFYNMRQYYQLLKDDVFNYLPLTYHLTKGTEDKEFRNFLKKFKEIEKESNDYDDSKKGRKPKNVWIVKPGEITNRGTGIQVCDSLEDIKRILTSKEKHNNGKEKTYIVQKYIDRPFLYNRRKFDIRAYMLITCINGIMRAYWYQEGYIRTSGREFDLSDVSDVFIHLTNDAIQKDSEEYNKYEPGNKLSYFEFQRYLDIWYSDQKYNIFSQIVPKMKAIATDSVRATFLKLDPQRKQNNFEVFGLDFMIDDKFKPYLIEINTNPAIETTCPICLRVIPGMIENALRIGLDPLFPPPANWPGQKKHLTPDSLTEHNRFEIIFDELYDGIEIKRLYKNQENCLEGVNDLDEDEEIDDEKSNKDKDEDKEFEFD